MNKMETDKFRPNTQYMGQICRYNKKNIHRNLIAISEIPSGIIRLYCKNKGSQ